MRHLSIGFAAGIIVGASAVLLFSWWKEPKRSAQDSAIYDRCLLQTDGDVVTCDAFMRVIAREKNRKTSEFKFSALCQAEMEKADQKLAEYKQRNVLPTADEAFPECVERERKAYEQSPNRNPP
jgi:hypothetical protein